MHVQEDNLRKKSPQVYVVRLERQSLEKASSDRHGSSLIQGEDQSFMQAPQRQLALESSRISQRSARHNRLIQNNPFFAFTFDCENSSYAGNYLIAVSQDARKNLDLSVLQQLEVQNISRPESLVAE